MIRPNTDFELEITQGEVIVLYKLLRVSKPFALKCAERFWIENIEAFSKESREHF